MPPSRLLRLPADLKPLQRVLADGLQHHEARLPVCIVTLIQQALVEQRLKTIQYVEREIALRIAVGLGGLKRVSPDKDRKPAEQRLFSRLEQLIAPIDRGAQRLLVGGQVACAAPQKREPAGQAPKHGL